MFRKTGSPRPKLAPSRARNVEDLTPLLPVLGTVEDLTPLLPVLETWKT
jgi:hypothetical protein